MFLNRENTKIVSHLDNHNFTDLKKSYLYLLENNIKIGKNENKSLLKTLDQDNPQIVKNKLIDIFTKFDVPLKFISISSERVKKHRKKIRDQGYKNLSLMLPAHEHDKLRSMKIRENMTYSELIIFLMSKSDTKLS